MQLSTFEVVRMPPPEQIEIPPGCGIFSMMKTSAPASVASMAAIAPA
jgi:hypothetical protein